jgi:hypothetical protein
VGWGLELHPINRAGVIIGLSHSNAGEEPVPVEEPVMAKEVGNVEHRGIIEK